MNKYICIHGHFYQPPRENAWLEYVEQQDSANPFHDWNDRITTECYAPNMASRILGPDGHIIDIVNNYSRISFNFGPTLLSWLEVHRPEVYNAIIEADKKSMERYSGHGSAIAQVYNHMIMPLANKRDKVTQVKWGIRDFEKRFGRYPEGMWLPETAVDTESLEVLASEGIKFTILAPHQASRVRKLGRGGRWHDVSGGRIKPTMPYVCKLPSGNSINLFFYDGPLSQDIAFGGLLYNGENFARRLIAGFNDEDEPQMVHIATDGETYGHHHRHGEMALTYCFYHIQQQENLYTTIYPAYLSKYPSTFEVEIVENSSWSCIHGVGRWSENCGCHSGMHPDWNQEWRKPLREALDWLREKMIPFYDHQMSQFVKDPWEMRDQYINVILNRSDNAIEHFLTAYSINEPSTNIKKQMLKLLELQRNAMLMYTSCGWFFDEISGIETVQIMQYASRVMQIAEYLGENSLEEEFLTRLEKAPSNVYKNGREAYDKYVKPTRVDLLRVGAHYAVSSLFEKYPAKASVYCYTAESHSAERYEAGKLKITLGKANITSQLTLADKTVEYAVLHLGDHNMYGGVMEHKENSHFDDMCNAMKIAFEKTDVPEVIRLMEKYFGTHSYSMRHLFKDDQRKILDKSQILSQSLQTAESFYRQIYDNNYSTLTYLRELNIPIPVPLRMAIEYTINTELQRVFDNRELDLYKLENLIKELKKWNIDLDTSLVSLKVSTWVTDTMIVFSENTDNTDLLKLIEIVVGLLHPLNAKWDLWQAQNLYHKICKNSCKEIRKRQEAGDEEAKRWMQLFKNLGNHLKVNFRC
jgi:alpha-amylase/alpha-mannosidase (GH57 family)